MVGISGGGGGGGGGYNYVQDSAPSGPEEGEEWYDTGANAAFVYDGAAWVEQTVVDHGQLTGVGTSDHHTKPTSTDSFGGGAGEERVVTGTGTYVVNGYVTRVQGRWMDLDESSPGYLEVNIWGGGTNSYELHGSGESITVYPDDFVRSVSMSGGSPYNNVYVDLNIGSPNHSHNI